MTDATEHLAKAANYIAKGEGYYRKAAEEIVAAMKADTTLSYAGAAAAVGKSKDFARRLVLAYTNDARASDGDGDLIVDWQSGDTRSVRTRLHEADPEQIAEQFLSDPTIRAKVAQAQEIAHETQRKQIRAQAGTDEPALADEDYGQVRERFNEIHESSVLPMQQLFTALSAVRVAGIEKLVSNASAKQRREWGERLPDEIALLQFALDLCKTQKLKAVK